MTVSELRDLLDDVAGDVEVRIVHQPGWPLQEVIGGLYEPNPNTCQFDENGCGYGRDAEIHDPDSADFDHRFEGPPENVGPVVYLVANGHPAEGSPYGDKEAWDLMRRS